MTLIAFGINHQTAPVALREQVAFDSGSVGDALVSLLAQPGIHEALILSTCNRTEIYCHSESASAESLFDWLKAHCGLDQPTLAECFYWHSGNQAVRHLYRVATGLDSMVLGEPQILGQVKDAYQLCKQHGSLQAVLDRLLQSTFAVAKRVRSETQIGAHPVSIAFAAVRLAQQIFADLRQAKVLLIGAGETIELAARHLAQIPVKQITVANRTLANAQLLADSFGGLAIALDELIAHLPDADIVIASTAAREALLNKAQVLEALKKRRHRPIFMLDLAVPRDIAADVAELDDVYLYTVDDLGAVIAENMRSRLDAATEAEALIDLQVAHFETWLRSVDSNGNLHAMRLQSELHRDETLAKARRMLAAGRSADEALAFLAHTLTNKHLHTPTIALRNAAQLGDTALQNAIERLFQEPSGDKDAE